VKRCASSPPSQRHREIVAAAAVRATTRQVAPKLCQRSRISIGCSSSDSSSRSAGWPDSSGLITRSSCPDLTDRCLFGATSAAVQSSEKDSAGLPERANPLVTATHHSCALGGIRTPNLLIRSHGHGNPHGSPKCVSAGHRLARPSATGPDPLRTPPRCYTFCYTNAVGATRSADLSGGPTARSRRPAGLRSDADRCGGKAEARPRQIPVDVGHLIPCEQSGPIESSSMSRPPFYAFRDKPGP
jgi:hypothetical protein